MMRVKIIILKWCFGKKISASPCAKFTLDYVNKLGNTKKALYFETMALT